MKLRRQNEHLYWATRRFNNQVFPDLLLRHQLLLQKKNAAKNERKKHGWGSIFKEWARKYCDSTTLHGLKYVAERESHIVQRIVWIFLVTTMLLGAVFLVSDQVTQFLQSPTLITFAHEQTPINELPFPAITLCPHSQLKLSYFNLSWGIANQGNFSTEQERTFNLIIEWCRKYRFHGQKKKHFFTAEEFYQLSQTINNREACSKFLPVLAWAGFNVFNACEVVQPITTKSGGCFAFNMLPLDQILRNPNTTIIAESWATKFLGRERIWSPDTGFTSRGHGIPMKDRTPPWAPLPGAIFNAVNFLMMSNRTAYDPLCKGGNNGFRGYIHNPAELPMGGIPFAYADENTKHRVKIEPTLYTLDPRLEAWPPETRGCYLQNERFLSFFIEYTQGNCETECAANTSMVKCGCVPYYYPRLIDTPVCGPEKVRCLDLKEDISCGCLPACSNLEYIKRTTSTTKGDWPTDNIDNEPKPKELAYSMLQVTIHGQFVQAIRRSVMFGTIEFFANAGGLLTLFLGFSLLSLVELFYFVTFKFWEIIKQNQR